MDRDIEIRIISGREMNASWQPDGVVWPEGSVCVCAYDKTGKLKGRVGMIILPHIEGFWVTHEHLATGLSQALEAEMCKILKEKMNATHVLTFLKEKANGLAKTIEAGGWDDQHLKVYAKELKSCQ